MRRKRDFQEVTAKEHDFIGASARLAPPSSSLLKPASMRRGFPERSSQPRSHRRVSKSHLAEEESATAFSWRFFLLPPPPRRCNPSVLGPLSPSPTIPLSLFLRTFSSCLISPRSSSTAGFLLFWSLILRGRGRREQFARIRTKKLVPPGGGPRSFARQPVQIPAHTAQSRFHEFPRRIWSPPIDAEISRESCRLSASSSLRSSSARTLWRKLLAARRDERRIVFLGLDSSFATLPPVENSAGGLSPK